MHSRHMNHTPIQLIDELRTRIEQMQEKADWGTTANMHYSDALMHLDLARRHYRKARFERVHDPDVLYSTLRDDWGYDDA